MNTKTNKTLSILMLLAGVLLVGFSTGRWLAPLAAWIGPALILRYSRDYKSWPGYLLLLVGYIAAFLIGFGAMWVSAWGVGLMSGLAIGYAFLWTLPYLADRWKIRRLSGFSSTLVYPLAATTLEFLNIHTNPVGMWGATGFTQYGSLPLMQLASVTGMIGITFLMGWFASVANWAWEQRVRGGQILRGVGTFGAIIAAVFVFGYLRLNLRTMNEVEGTVRVAGITARGLETVGEQIGAEASVERVRGVVQSHQDTFFAETVREAQAGASVILWPEVSAPTFDTDEASLIARAQEVARQSEVYLVMPIFTMSADSPEYLANKDNKLVLIDPSGTVVMEHIKYGGAIFESTRVGDGVLQTVDTPFGVLSAVICYDMDYPATVQQAGRNGTGLMLAPSRDWLEIDPVHTHMAVFRAIENGMSVVRQTDRGLSLAADPYGRVLAQSDYFGATDRTMVAQVPVKHVTTTYTLFGRYLEWLAPIGLMFLAVKAFAGRNKE